ncbi:MAG: hypothetical protein DI568_14930 [Sphingomonas sp.]|nr:MAG: hypothetical protein DI568_14930 [Sphingomonas sp.]
MPALLAALGAGFAWIAKYIVILLAGETFRKAILFVSFNVVFAILMDWILNKLGFDVTNLDSTLNNLLGGLPQFLLYVLREWGILAALWIVLQAQVSVMFVRLAMRALGAGGR